MALTKLNNAAISSITNAGLPALDHTNMPAGTIIQVKRNVGSTEYPNTSTSSYVTIADITTSITPKAANSILFFQISGLCFTTGMSSGQTGTEFILEDTTNSVEKEKYRGVNFTNNNGSSYQTQSMQQFCFNFSESASNTNARTYALKFRIEPTFDNCSSIIIGWPDNNTGPQSMVIYEIAQ